MALMEAEAEEVPQDLVEVYIIVELVILFLKIAPYHQIWLSEESIQMDLQMEEISQCQEILVQVPMAGQQERAEEELEEMQQVIIPEGAVVEVQVDLEAQEVSEAMAVAVAEEAQNLEEDLLELVD
mgnify:CR=1 FL=1